MATTSSTLSSGITTTSMFNTPQAVDDAITISEDSASVIYLDVMLNDLGGNAKTLYAITAGSESGVVVGNDAWTDLISKDAVGASDASEKGASISIVDGKIAYDTSGATIAAIINALGVGDSFTDHITYTIRLGNGTLSMAPRRPRR